MKKVVSVFLTVVTAVSLLLSLSGCGLFYSSDYRRGPAMWVVEDTEGNICYLFGSVHVGKGDGMFPFADIIEDAFESCDQLALEYDMIAADKERENMNERELAEYYASIFMYKDGTTVKDHISEASYNSAVEFLKKKEIYSEELDYFNAAYWSMLIDNVITDDQGEVSENGVDLYFANKAYKENKTVVSIESEQAQIDMLLSVNDKVYDMMIQSSVASSGSIFGAGLSTKILMNAYKKGNMDTLERLISASRLASYDDEELNAAMQDYDKKMYTERNRLMADTVKQFLSDGKKTFVVVGCAHMLCNDGIVALLSNEGYKVYRK